MEKLTEFRDYCLQNEGWEEVLRDKIQVEYLRKTESSNVVALKVISHDFEDYTPEYMYEVINDGAFHGQWDPYLMSWKNIEQKTENCYVVQMLMKVPVITNREFIFDCTCGVIGEGEEAEYIIRMETTDDSKWKVADGFVRGTIGLSGYLIRKENGKTVVYTIGNSDIGGIVPAWFINKMAKSAVPDMLKGLKQKIPGYEKFKEKQAKK